MKEKYTHRILKVYFDFIPHHDVSSVYYPSQIPLYRVSTEVSIFGKTPQNDITFNAHRSGVVVFGLPELHLEEKFT
jgi:hypothetical protein